MESEDVQSTFIGLLTQNVLPWGLLSSYIPKGINRNARKAGDLLQAIMLPLFGPWFASAGIFVFLINLPTFYDPDYLENKQNCTHYYLFNMTSFEHYINEESVYHPTYVEGTQNCSNYEREDAGSDKAEHIDNCLHLPIFVFCAIATLALRTLMGIGLSYSIDRRYGFLRFRNKNVVFKLRQMHIMIQLPVILILIPFNIAVSIMLPFLVIPLVLSVASFNCAYKIIAKVDYTISNRRSLGTKFSNERYGTIFFRDKEITFLYMYEALQDLIPFPMWIFVYAWVGYGTKFFVILEPFTKVRPLINAYMVYRLIQLYKARSHFRPLLSAFKRTIPLFQAFWSLVDIILDIIQTRKYKLLSITICISPLYFRLSIASFIFPVIICFITLLIKQKNTIFSPKAQNKSCSYTLSGMLCYVVRKIALFLLYLVIAVVLYYIILPIVLVKISLDTIRKGEDEERLEDWDPFKLVSRYTGYRGILGLLGFTSVKSKHMPLITGVEQLGEASIQTALSMVFIYQNYGDHWFNEHDKLFGVQFPIFILSLVFSLVSFLSGIIQLALIIISKINEIHRRISFENATRGSICWQWIESNLPNRLSIT